MSIAILEAPQVALMTAEELLMRPDDGYRYELIRGELKRMTPAGFFHGSTGMYLAGPLSRHVDDNDLGVILLAETGFLIATDPDTLRAPDIAFVRKERIPASGPPQGYFRGAPDLAVEVVSPGDTVYDVEEKVAEWLAAGAQQVWVVNPKRRTVAVHATGGVLVLGERDELSGGKVVPGFSLALSQVFR